MARQGLLEFTNIPLGLTKWGLIIFNIVFWSMGVVSLALGLYLYLDNNEYATFSEGRDLLGSVFLVAVGFGIIIVGFLGIVAAVWESVIIATFFGGLVTLAGLMFFCVGVWSVIHDDEIEEDSRREMDLTSQFYFTNLAYRDVWDSLQRRFECCGIDNFTDWEGLVPQMAAPSSCCINETDPGCGLDPPQDYYTVGCLGPIVSYEQDQYDIMGPFGFVVGVFQGFGIALCILLCVTVSSTKGSYDASG